MGLIKSSRCQLSQQHVDRYGVKLDYKAKEAHTMV